MSYNSKVFLAQKYRNPHKNTRKFELSALLIFLLTLAMFWGILSGMSELKAYADEAPTEEKIRDVLQDKGENSKIFDRHGTLLYEFKDPDRDREYIEYEEIPPQVIAVLLAAEDEDFFIHEGIDFVGMVRGIAVTYSSGGEKKVGGSTITQQLVKQTLLTSERTTERKVREAVIALMVERDYGKEEIIEFYMNVTNYGGRIVGIRTAAKTYFNKDVSELSLNEAAFLVALVQSPGDYSPLFATDRERAEELVSERRGEILVNLSQNPQIIAYLNSGDSNWLRKQNFEMSEGEEELGLTDPGYTIESIEALIVDPVKISEQGEQQLLAPHFVFYVRDLLGKSPYNYSIEELYSRGLRIHTSLDLGVQSIFDQKLKEGVDAYGPRYGFENGAAVMVDARDGEIIAMSGSKGFHLQHDSNNKKFDPQVNVATADNELGSTMKPFAYMLAFDTGRYNGATKVQDKPRNFYGGGYRPKNYDGKFYGEMNIRKALLDSRNLPILSITYDVGDWRLPELMTKIGYKEENNYGLAAVIGGVNETLLDHTFAYTGFANGGSVMDKKPVLKITDSHKKEIFVADDEVKYQFNGRSVAMVNNILGDKSYQPFTYHYKFIGPSKLAGKTGTSDGNKETLYMGYGPSFVTGVLLGNNDNTRLSSSALGSTTALPVWNSIMRQVLAKYPEYNSFGSY